jgi:rod shape determining protein RodA
MWRKLFDVWRSWDGTLFALTLSLLFIGLAGLYSTSLSQPAAADLFPRQLIGVGLGLFILFIIAALDYRTYRSWSRIIYLSAMTLLVAVLLLGRTVRGTTGWLRFGILNFQPVEAVKFLWVMALASYLAHAGPPLTAKKTLVASLLLVPLLGLVLAQPDFGSGLILVVVWGVLLAAMPKPKHWWLMMGLIILTVGLMGSFFLKDYQRGRLLTFFDPQADPLGRGYNVTQSIIAVGAGGLWGRGLGLGTQSQLQFLPEQHTDFIFASISEELGLVGGGLILVLWLAFFTRLIWLIRRLRDDFAVLVGIGIFSIFASQVVLNIGMNLGLAPVVGLTLPFFSFGSSSLVMSLAAVGVLENLARQYGRNAPQDALGSIDR